MVLYTTRVKPVFALVIIRPAGKLIYYLTQRSFVMTQNPERSSHLELEEIRYFPQKPYGAPIDRAEASFQQTPLLMNLNAGSWSYDDEPLSGTFYKEMLSPEEKVNLIRNIIKTMQGLDLPDKDQVIRQQLYHFFKIDTLLGMAVAEGLKVKITSVLFL